ncbi:secreted venom allergen-like protein vap2, partial [Aphelenchoides avenae]
MLFILLLAIHLASDARAQWPSGSEAWPCDEWIYGKDENRQTSCRFSLVEWPLFYGCQSCAQCTTFCKERGSKYGICVKHPPLTADKILPTRPCSALHTCLCTDTQQKNCAYCNRGCKATGLFISGTCAKNNFHDCQCHYPPALTKTQRDAVLPELNKRRDNLALGKVKGHPSNAKPLPKAGNLQKLKWDTNLELLARKWVSTCTFSSTDDFRDTVGVNGGFTTSTSSVQAMKTAIANNWNHNKEYSYDAPEIPVIAPEAFNPNIKQFSQIAYHRQTRVGCAAT